MRELRPGWAPPQPRGQRCSHGRRRFTRPPLAVPPRPGLAPRFLIHLPGPWVTRHQQGFTHVRPSGLPLACAPGWNETRFGFCPELRTPQLPATHVRAGTGPEHWPGAMPPTSSALQSASSLATSDLVSHVFRPVDPAECVQVDPPFPYAAAVRAGPGRAGHARSLMEGLKGTAIRLAVRNPGCPQAPVLARARRLLALIRGSSCGWLRPRPPIPARTTRSQHPARRVARQPGKSAASTGTPIFDERSRPGDVNGSPGAASLGQGVMRPDRYRHRPAGRSRGLKRTLQPRETKAVICHVPIRDR